MMLFIRAIALLGLVPSALAYPGRQQPLAPATSRPASPRPLVVWHGLGDTAASEGMASIKKDIEGMYPGIFVMNVKVPGEGSLDDERKAGFVSRPPLDQKEAAWSRFWSPVLWAVG
jgi:palmitoyl-protein thioesterase